MELKNYFIIFYKFSITGNMKGIIFNKDKYINEELKKANVKREDFDRWVNILKEEYKRENGK